MLIQDNSNYTIIGEPSQIPKGIIIFFKAGSSIRSTFLVDYLYILIIYRCFHVQIGGKFDI